MDGWMDPTDRWRWVPCDARANVLPVARFHKPVYNNLLGSVLKAENVLLSGGIHDVGEPRVTFGASSSM